MVQNVQAHGAVPGSFCLQMGSCLEQIVACVQAIWKRVYDWMYAWLNPPLLQDPLVKLKPDCFYKVVGFLPPEGVALCERVCHAWKMPDKVWQAQCKQEKVSYQLAEGHHKEAFSNPQPPAAFGIDQWREYFHLQVDPNEIIPRLPARIHRLFVKEKYTLTLLPPTVSGEPFSLHTFKSVAADCGMNIIEAEPIPDQYKREPVGRWRWVLMQKGIAPESANKRYPEVTALYAGKLGKALWVMVSAVAHQLRTHEVLFPDIPGGELVYTWTREGFLVGSGEGGVFENREQGSIFIEPAPVFPGGVATAVDVLDRLDA